MEKQQQEQLEALSEIRSLMERSSRFLSLSGLSGVFAGLYALAGAGAAWLYLERRNIVAVTPRRYYEYAYDAAGRPNISFYTFFVTVALTVLVLSIGTGLLLTYRQSKKKGLPFFDRTARRLLINMLIPLGTGGLFCLIMFYHKLFGFVAPATLIFYGLSLVHASKYTLNDIRFLGLAEIVLGLLAAISPGSGLLYWALGFGVLHIIYGSMMYYKYER